MLAFPPAQPRRGDHRRGGGRADRGGQRVQPADQDRLALNLGVPERSSLLAVSVDAALGGVHVDEGELASAGQQRRPAGQLSQQQPAHLLQLADVAPGERAQERSQRGRRPDPVEQRAHRPVPQHVHVVDAVGARCHPGDQAADLHLRVRPARIADHDVAADQRRQAGPLGQAHHRHQAGPRHQIRLVEACGDLQRIVRQSHPAGVLSARDSGASATPIVPAQRTPFTLPRSQTALFAQWIEAKPLPSVYSGAQNHDHERVTIETALANRAVAFSAADGRTQRNEQRPHDRVPKSQRVEHAPRRHPPTCVN